MILVADSGATKTDWCLLDGMGANYQIATQGLNPTYITDDDVLRRVFSDVARWTAEKTSPRQIFFYGAGCSSSDSQNRIIKLFAETFPFAQVAVDTDLMGACRACCGNNDGIVGILGTGSNSCVYENTEIAEKLPSLGYLLGDEGSGTDIGRGLLKAFLNGDMPEYLTEDFYKHFPLTYAEVIDTLYHKPSPNKFFASLTPFAAEHKNDSFVIDIVHECISSFFENQICKYKRHRNNDLYFVGSVAAIFEDVLIQCTANYGYNLKNIVRSPIKGLCDFHIQQKLL